MKQVTHQLHIATHGKGLYEFTGQIETWVRGQQAHTGLLTVFCQHTSASLVIQENADPDVVADLADFFTRLVPEDTAALSAHRGGAGRHDLAHPLGVDRRHSSRFRFTAATGAGYLAGRLFI